MLGFVGAFEIFTWPLIATHGGPGIATQTILLYIYKSAFQTYDFGYSAVMSLISIGILVSFLTVMTGLAKRWVHYRARMTTGGLMARHEKVGPKGIRTMGTRRKILSPHAVSRLAVASVLVVVGALMLLPVASALYSRSSCQAHSSCCHRCASLIS